MSEVGRPTVMTPETIAKLEEAFLNGASDKEACFIAGIGVSTLYKYQEENPEYVERKDGLKNMLKYQARVNVAKSLNEGELDTSLWFLEKKAKDEFSARNEITGADGKAVTVIALPSELTDKNAINTERTNSN